MLYTYLLNSRQINSTTTARSSNTHALCASEIKKIFSLIIGALTFIPCLCTGSDNLIDHKVSLNTGGIYRAQDAVPIALGLITLTGALTEGTESRLGKTFWQSGEALLFTSVITQGVKYITQRERPKDSNDPNNWFQSSGNSSFPSYHVAATTAMVTPFIAEYKDEYPWVMGLALLPAYEMVARVKSNQHWQTDVLAGAAIGLGFALYERKKEKPWVVTLLPGGAFIGFRKKF